MLEHDQKFLRRTLPVRFRVPLDVQKKKLTLSLEFLFLSEDEFNGQYYKMPLPALGAYIARDWVRFTSSPLSANLFSCIRSSGLLKPA